MHGDVEGSCPSLQQRAIFRALITVRSTRDANNDLFPSRRTLIRLDPVGTTSLSCSALLGLQVEERLCFLMMMFEPRGQVQLSSTYTSIVSEITFVVLGVGRENLNRFSTRVLLTLCRREGGPSD
jgi:hypothetical protein